ncbi:hypothetical protein L2E82_38247 [Cichorium intybus]|uniref:Uncharacterized protein n=1 Tax=Cichorium intybus TaxID=13427 RepID=A0ACB9AG19_CICIN|nr:hypothetical protein L2E82_38247 [Cichorium intybus]
MYRSWWCVGVCLSRATHPELPVTVIPHPKDPSVGSSSEESSQNESPSVSKMSYSSGSSNKSSSEESSPERSPSPRQQSPSLAAAPSPKSPALNSTPQLPPSLKREKVPMGAKVLPSAVAQGEQGTGTDNDDEKVLFELPYPVNPISVINPNQSNTDDDQGYAIHISTQPSSSESSEDDAPLIIKRRKRRAESSKRSKVSSSILQKAEELAAEHNLFVRNQIIFLKDDQVAQQLVREEGGID